MSFTGFSSDEDGSIIYDGVKFIVTNPRKVPANFNPGKKPVIGLPADHPSLAPRSSQPPGKYASDRRNHDDSGRDGRDHGESVSSQPLPSDLPPATEYRDISGLDLENAWSSEINLQAMMQELGAEAPDYHSDRPLDAIDADRLIAYCNPEFQLVRQDIEARPQTFKTCFEISATLRGAMEIIYAECPDLSDRELALLQEEAERMAGVALGMGGGSDDEASYDLSVPQRSLIRYEDYLGDKYGFTIEWGAASDETNMAGQLNNLEKAVGYIVKYLAAEVYEGDESKALKAIQQHFSNSSYGQLAIRLGADSEAKGASYGRVPLPESSAKGLDEMYLGSNVNIATIVHEFGHVIDRSLGIEDAYSDKGGSAFPWTDWKSNVGLPLNELILQHAIGGYAGKQFLAEETWSDLFMTAVLDPSNSYIREAYTVFSTTYSAHNEFVNERAKEIGKPYIKDHGEEAAFRIGRSFAIAEFYDCAVHGDCKRLEVKWAEKEPGDWRDYGALAREHFPTLLRHLLSGH